MQEERGTGHLSDILRERTTWLLFLLGFSPPPNNCGQLSCIRPRSLSQTQPFPLSSKLELPW